MAFPKPPEKLVPFNSGPVQPHDIGRQFDEHRRGISSIINFLKTIIRDDGVMRETSMPPPRRGGSKEPTLPVGALGPNAGGFYAGDDKGATATSADYAQVSIDWAEHMSDTIPPNTLAINAITGDHWSSRWWANQAALSAGQIVGNYLPLAGGAMTGTLIIPAAAYLNVAGGATGQVLTATSGGGLGWSTPTGTFIDAPANSQYYSRYNNAWVVSPGGLIDAPNDGVLYARKSQVWAAVASSTVPPVMTRTALAAVDTTKCVSAVLLEAGREGVFIFKTGDYSASITADTQQGVFVKATAVAATAGAWVRTVVDRLVPEWFGALKNGVNDDSVAINAALAMAVSLSLPEVALSGVYTTANSIIPQTGVVLRGSGAWARINVNANIAVLSSSGATPLIRAGVEKIKFVNASSTNANAVGLWLDACQRCTFRDLDFFNYDAGVFATIMPTITFNSGAAATYGPDYQNFVWNVIENIMVAKCKIGMVFRGGGPTWNATLTNVITSNVYRNVCLRQVTSDGIYSDFWHDNDHFYDTFINICADGAAAIVLSASDPTAYRGVSAHHFFGTIIVRDPSVSWTNMYGVVLHNANGCLFTGLGSDTFWEIPGEFFSNSIPVDVYVLASYMHFPSGDTSQSAVTNRMAHITQNTMTRQSASVTVASSATSTVVTFPKPLLIAPVAGKGVIQLTPYLDPGVRYWVDYTTITATGFTIKYSAPVPGAFPMLWTAEVFAVA